MLVTEIRELPGGRSRIRIDDEAAIVLYKGEMRTLGIEEDCEIEDETYQKIMTQILPVRAKKRVLNLLKSRDYTAAQLLDKLKMGGYPDRIAEEAAAYAASFGYVDDERYALTFIESHKENRSRKRIFMDLLKRGISEAVVAQAWDEAVGEEPQESQELEKEQIIHWAAKKNFSSQTATLQEKQRMMAFLYRKGFSVENIRSALLLDITSN